MSSTEHRSNRDHDRTPHGAHDQVKRLRCTKGAWRTWLAHSLIPSRPPRPRRWHPPLRPTPHSRSRSSPLASTARSSRASRRASASRAKYPASAIEHTGTLISRTRVPLSTASCSSPQHGGRDLCPRTANRSSPAARLSITRQAGASRSCSIHSNAPEREPSNSPIEHCVRNSAALAGSPPIASGHCPRSPDGLAW